MSIQIVRRMDGKLKLVFGYDAELVAKVRDIPGARYDKDGKFWTVPESSRVAVDELIILERIRHREMSIEMNARLLGYGTYPCHASEAPETGRVLRIREAVIQIGRIRSLPENFVSVHYERATDEQVAALEAEEAVTDRP